MLRALKNFILGKPLHNKDLVRERLSKWKALAIFSSDALSSVAYGPEMVILILSTSGLIAYGYALPVSLAILVLLAIVTISYVQVAKANPGGGGSYSVGKANLGEIPALTAASALLIDYSLTVAVSVSAGTDAIISAIPLLLPYRLLLNLLVIFGILTLVNLRGIRESATIFVFPTYAFMFGIFLLIGFGIFQAVNNPLPILPPASREAEPLNPLVLFLILRAFSNGCSSMTGIEAISNGVPMFRDPEYRNAQLTTYSMSILLGSMFLGISLLNMHYHLIPMDHVTMLSQLAENVFSRGVLYYYIQITTMLILYLAANTAYNGLPPLLSLLARDGYMPRYLSARGDRLAFSNGIILLSIIASALVITYHGNTEHLISLYAVGVFLSFSIAQTGMVVFWRRNKEKGWQIRAVLNGAGTVITTIVVVVIMITKFTAGAWMVLIAIPVIIYILKKIKGHYLDMGEQLSISHYLLEKQELPIRKGKHIVVVPAAGVTQMLANTLSYAVQISNDVHVVHISVDEDSYKKFKIKWDQWNPGVELTIIRSSYRTIMLPILRYLDNLEAELGDSDFITVVIPEFQTIKWWHRLLHKQSAFILENLLVFRKKIAVCVVPFPLKK